MKRVLLALLACTGVGWSQRPVITPGGVVNAASYSAGIGYQTDGGPLLAVGSIASIFGTSLAASTQTAQTPTLPMQLGGTSVIMNGAAAPLFFVSPTQINFQVPTRQISNAGVIVSTVSGQSDPYQVADGGQVPAIFTANSSGCGLAAVLNVAADGSVSLNSPANSAAPGNFISIYGTGLGNVSNPPPDGTPAPLSPLARAFTSPGPVFDFSAGGKEGQVFFAGRAPGLIGVDQFNFLVPPGAREGCTVPLQMRGRNISPPVTISIATGGGPCADPPAQGYGEILWEKVITTDPPVAAPNTPTGISQNITETNALTVSLQASPGRQAPTPLVYSEGGTLPPAYTFFGSQCPVPGYRSLAAGNIVATGVGLATLSALTVPLRGGTVINISPTGGTDPVSQVPSGQVSGLTVSQATFPVGTIQAGAFSVAASGGADIGAFQATVNIGAPIQVVTALAGRILHSQGPPFTITWTGGDPNSWVTLKLVAHFGPEDYFPFAWVTRASNGKLTIQGFPKPIGFAIGGPVEMIMEVVPDPADTPVIAVPGLSLGARNWWKYTYRFEGVLVQD